MKVLLLAAAIAAQSGCMTSEVLKAAKGKPIGHFVITKAEYQADDQPHPEFYDRLFFAIPGDILTSPLQLYVIIVIRGHGLDDF